MSSSVTRSQPFLVNPAEAKPAGDLHLTAMDRALASLPMAALLVFHNPIDQPAESIKRALSRALVPYYPMAGRLTVTGDQLKIACTGDQLKIGNMERKVVPACILCGRKDKAEGVAAMALCVRQEQAEAFHAELQSLK